MAFTEVLAELAVNLRLDSSAFARGSTAAAASAKKLEGRMLGFGQRIGGVTGALGGLAGMFTGGLLIGGATALAGKLVELGKGALDHAAALHVESQQLGVTTDDLQRFRFAAGQVGLEQDKVDLGLKRLNKSIGLADRGLGPGAKAFAAMGISVRDAAGHLKTVGQIMPEIAGYISRLPDPAARAALEFQLFGRSGQDMAPLLNAGADGVRNLTAAADKAGVVISPQLIERAHQLEVRFTKLKEVVSTKVEVGLLTALNGIADVAGKVIDRGNEFDARLKAMQDSADAFDKRMGIPTRREFVDSMGIGQTASLANFNKMLEDLQKRADDFDKRMGIPTRKEFIDSISDDFNRDLAERKVWRDQTFAILESIPAKLQGTWQAFDHWWNAITESTHRMVGDVETSLKSRLSSAMDWAKTKAHEVADAFHSMYDRVVAHSYVPDMVNGISAEFGRLGSEMVDPSVAATEKVAVAFQSLQSVLAKVLGKKAGGILGAIAQFASALAPLFGGGGFDQASFASTESSNAAALGLPGNFFHRALGGPVVPGRTYMVGENGPEYVRFGSRGYVTPPKGGGPGAARVTIEPSEYFTAVVRGEAARVSAPMAGRAAVTGAAGAEAKRYRTARRSIP